MTEAKHTERFNTLLAESRVLAERINRARFEGTVPTACDTVRLCALLDFLLDMED